MNNKNRVFISYSYKDKLYADKISSVLINNNIEVFSDNNIEVGEKIFEKHQYMYEASETMLILLSKHFFNSESSLDESEQLFNLSQKRKITIIVINLDNCKVPNYLQNFLQINILKDFDKSIEQIIEKLKRLPEINLNKFTPYDFEIFVSDLLKEYKFTNLILQHSDDSNFDLIGNYWNKDPFGIKTKETWLIEIKYYGADRFSLNSILKIVSLYNINRKPNTKVLLVTNSILTSVAEDFLNKIKNEDNIPIHILDGNAIKGLIARRKRLINKYFIS